jgi:1-acyl-sn-glycerol-3-phosphate acyltransferase
MMTRMRRRAADMTRGYRFVVAVNTPVMWWSRLEVTGLEHLPATGPALVVADHDSYWDPMAIAVAAAPVRQIQALAKSTLWKNKFVAAIMTETGQIPIERGVSNEQALKRAIDELRAGACIGVFPEGTRSLGRDLRARSGVGRLAEAVPEAVVVCVATNGSVDVVRAPKRPHVTVEFYRPAGGQLQPGETAAEFAERLLAELRERAPREIPGRKRRAAKYRADAAPS